MNILLIPFSFLYLLIICLRDLFYNTGIFRQYKIGAKVISIGNITWGGTGKTPAVLSVAVRLIEEGRKAAILTRGYGGDEQALLSKAANMVPVLSGKDRVKSGREAIERYAVDTVLLDDGFQYRRMKRDLDIVCIDAVNPFGNRCLIPAGPMREGMAGLRRADIFLLTKVDLVRDQNAAKRLEERLKKINPDALIVKSVHKPKCFYKLSNEQLVGIENVRNKKIVLLSAIGSPRSFEKTILNLSMKFKRHFIFRDHYWYDDKDLGKIERYCVKNKIDTVITTEKDAVRLRALNHKPSTVNFFVLGIELEIIENEQGFHDRLSGIYNS